MSLVRLVGLARVAARSAFVLRAVPSRRLSILPASQPPRGFENYFPRKKDGSSSTPPPSGSEKPDEKSSEKKDEKKDFKQDFQGSGGPKKPEQPFVLSKIQMIALGLATVGVGIAALPRDSVPEITWQQFYNDLLQKKLVQNVIVINNSVVRVYLKPGVNISLEHRHGSDGADEDVLVSHPTHDTSTAYGADHQHESASGSTSQDGSSQLAWRKHSFPEAAFQFTIGSVDHFEQQLEQAQQELGWSSAEYIPALYRRETSWGTEILRMLPTVALFGIWWFLLTRQGGMGGAGAGKGIFSMGKASPVIVSKAEEVTTSFNDVAGLIEAKAEIMEFVSFLRNPGHYTQLGARIPKGALLTGPPGCGKTLLARAVAGEAKVPFLSVSGSDFVEMFVGVGPSRVRDLFAQARSHAPCILFIDEIDAVGRARGRSGFAGGGNDERENTLNQMLVEMDGFSTTSGVIVLAGTNRADVLDKALLRPGRFDRQITVDKPDVAGREQIFAVHLRPLKLAHPMEHFIPRLAALTPGFSGADIASVCNEAALIAARREAESVDHIDFDRAVDRVIGGLEKKTSVIAPDEKRIVAHHEAGHATAGWFLEHAAPLLKVSIIPRSKALGYAQYLPKEDYLTTKEQLDDMMCVALGGRVAEELIFGKVTSGAQDDLEKVTKIAQAAVTVYGMSEAVGPLAFPPRDGQQDTTRPYSDAMARLIDSEVRRFVTNAHKRTTTLLKSNLDGMKKLAALLMEKESVDVKDVVAMLGPRPYPVDPRVERLMNATNSSPPA